MNPTGTCANIYPELKPERMKAKKDQIKTKLLEDILTKLDSAKDSSGRNPVGDAVDNYLCFLQAMVLEKDIEAKK